MNENMLKRGYGGFARCHSSPRAVERGRRGWSWLRPGRPPSRSDQKALDTAALAVEFVDSARRVDPRLAAVDAMPW